MIRAETWLTGAVVLAALVAVLFALASARRARADLAVARAESAEIRARLGDLDDRLDRLGRTAVGSDQSLAEPTSGVADYTITGLGDDAEPPARPDGLLFTDLVLRESVVKAAALTYGVRRALTPANRHRIRFEMRQEVQAARKQRRATRKAELRAARRLLREAEEAGAAEPADTRAEDAA